jgi:hypothetical protein
VFALSFILHTPLKAVLGPPAAGATPAPSPPCVHHWCGRAPPLR